MQHILDLAQTQRISHIKLHSQFDDVGRSFEIFEYMWIGHSKIYKAGPNSSTSSDSTAAIIYSLIETAKLNNVDPQAWLTDTLSRIADHKINKIDELLPGKYKG